MCCIPKATLCKPPHKESQNIPAKRKYSMKTSKFISPILLYNKSDKAAITYPIALQKRHIKRYFFEFPWFLATYL